MLELDGAAAIRAAGDGNYWARYVKNRRIGLGAQTGSTDPELQRVKAFFDAAASGGRRTDPRVLDAFLDADRIQRTKEREQEAALAECVAAAGLAPGHLIPSLEADCQRDQERFERTLADIARRDQERAREAEERDRVDRERRGPDVQVIAG
jgi:hypothetical protein